MAVIMAGGSGERFWPLSRRSRPKQLLRLGSGNNSLLDQAIQNIATLIPRERIFLATGNYIAGKVREAESDIPSENILVEPSKKNTAGCLVYAAANLLARYGGDGSNIVMAALPADHNILDTDRYLELAHAAFETAERENALVTFGIKPDRAETGYGYLEFDAEPAGPSPAHGIAAYKVAKFHEKPDDESAEKYLASGRHFWNSGMFFWRVSTFLEELALASPGMETVVRKLAEKIAAGDDDSACAAFNTLDSISIDYALMEKSQNVLAIRADFGWDDVGAWDSLDRTFPRDGRGNVVIGDPVIIDSDNTIVYNEPGLDSIAVGVLGVKDLVVIVTKDGVLVAPKDRAQEVRKVVDELKRRDESHL